ncbi:hypothetical protein ACQPU1_08140 [Clostridium paraputrificum]|uniref:hypothetical protein n=1 Tax=Clostridium TaxID=1485 RepID=UPI003D337626
MIDELKVAISEKDIEKARRLMKTKLLSTNYPHEVFKDAIDLAITYGVFEEHNNDKLIPDPKKWTNEYLEELIGALDINFSKERFMTTYYISRKLQGSSYKYDESYKVSVYDEYKDFFLLAQVGAAIIGATAVGIGVWLYRRNRKK